MRLVMSVGCLVAGIVVTGCRESTAPTRSALVGAWMAPRETLRPSGSMTRNLGFSENGTFVYTVNSYGVYGGNSPGQLSAYTITTGTYQVDGNHVALTATRIATWDSFYGAASPERVELVSRSIFDQARFTILGGLLTLDYITYPADAPVPTRLLFARLMPD
jgi:hypothetical protein